MSIIPSGLMLGEILQQEFVVIVVIFKEFEAF
jgi:hypothetical protein